MITTKVIERQIKIIATEINPGTGKTKEISFYPSDIIGITEYQERYSKITFKRFPGDTKNRSVIIYESKQELQDTIKNIEILYKTNRFAGISYTSWRKIGEMIRTIILGLVVILLILLYKWKIKI